MALLDADVGVDGPVALLAADQGDVEDQALQLVRAHALRSRHAWHLATAALVLPTLAEAGEEVGFASRDRAQSVVAETLGLRALSSSPTPPWTG